MANDFIKSGDEAFSAQMVTFKNNIGGYAATLGLSGSETGMQAIDATYFAYVLECQQLMQAGARQWTSWKDILRDGGEPPNSGVPVAPALPAAPEAVAPGIEARFRALAKRIKAHAAYNDAMGQALGIEAPESTGPDFSTLKPVLNPRLAGGAVEIPWGWQGYAAELDSIEILVDRGGGQGFVLLTIDTTAGYTDNAPAPAAPARWTYKAIYRVGDNRVGQWSDEAGINVGG